jgi:fluoroacetyl-CoA thioesterase
MLTAGDSGQAEILVQRSDTAKVLALSSEDSFPEVFATSRMIALMELAAARAMRAALQPGQLSVGVSLNVKHTAATPVGGKVRAVATYERNDGKLLIFKVEAFDDAGPIGAVPLGAVPGQEMSDNSAPQQTEYRMRPSSSSLLRRSVSPHFLSRHLFVLLESARRGPVPRSQRLRCTRAVER